MQGKVIDDILEKWLPEMAEADRAVWEFPEEAEFRRFGFDLLVTESLSMLEACLNRREEFSGPAGAGQLGLKPARSERMEVLRQALGLPASPPDAAGRGAEEIVAGHFAALIDALKSESAPLSGDPATIRFEPYTGFQDHVGRHAWKIAGAFKALPRDVLAFGYHGSIGSGDHVRGLSDCDAVAILRAGVIADPPRLHEVSHACTAAWRRMLRIDRFQHHGVFVIPSELFDWYPENYFPTVLYTSSAFDVGGGEHGAVRALFSRRVSFLRVLVACAAVERAAGGMRSLGYWSFHLVMQVAQLLPCFVAACCEHSMNKRDAIPWLAEKCSSEAAGFLKATTDARAAWGRIGRSGNIVRRILRRPAGRRLRDATIGFFGGPERLGRGLEALAADAAALARDSLRRARDGQ